MVLENVKQTMRFEINLVKIGLEMLMNTSLGVEVFMEKCSI